MGARGEGLITLPGGDEVEILFTNRALAEADSRMTRPVFAVVLTDLPRGEVRLADLAQMLRSGVNAANRDRRRRETITMDQAYNIMDSVGISEVMRVVMFAAADVLKFSANGDSAPESESEGN